MIPTEVVIISKIIFWIFISHAFMAVAEYVCHRWFMHKKQAIIHWWKFREIYDHHAIEHHGKGRLDINIDLPVYYHLILGLPILIGFLLANMPIAFGAFLSTFFYHSYAWTKIHRQIHDLETNWFCKLWLKPSMFSQLKRHHLKHHENPKKNFGVVYLWVDRFMETKA